MLGSVGCNTSLVAWLCMTVLVIPRWQLVASPQRQSGLARGSPHNHIPCHCESNPKCRAAKFLFAAC